MHNKSRQIHKYPSKHYISVVQYGSRKPHVTSGPLVCGYFNNFEVKIIFLSRALKHLFSKY